MPKGTYFLGRSSNKTKVKNMQRKIVALITISLMTVTGILGIGPVNAAWDEDVTLPFVQHNGPWLGLLQYDEVIIDFEAWVSMNDPPFHWIWTFNHDSGDGEDFTVHHNTSTPEDIWSHSFDYLCEYIVRVSVTNSTDVTAYSSVPVCPNLEIRHPMIDMQVEVHDLDILRPWWEGWPVYFVCEVWHLQGGDTFYLDGYHVDFFIQRDGSAVWTDINEDIYKTFNPPINLQDGYYKCYGSYWEYINPFIPYTGPIWEAQSEGTYYIKAKLSFEGEQFDTNPSNNEYIDDFKVVEGPAS